MWLRFLVVVFVLAGMPAWANSPDEARALIHSGQYVSARNMAESLETADGYALAAESLSAQILLGEIKKLNRRSKEARKLAETALALDPDNYNAKLQYVLNDGFVTRTSGDITAWRKKLPAKTLARIRDFRAAHPEDPRGLALEGAWHLGVLRKTGAKNGKKWFGASLEEGVALYNEARKRSPNDILIETNYVMALLVLDVEKYRVELKPVLESVMRLNAVTDVDRKIQKRASIVLSVFDDRKSVEKYAGRFLDGKTLD